MAKEVRDYEVKIKECSKELTTKERIQLKDYRNATSLDEATQELGKCVIKPVAFAVLNVHNEKSDSKDYEKIVIIAEDGTRYVTGSPTFIQSFFEIWEEIKDSGEDFSIEVYRVESKNYKGKEFLKCSVV